MEMRGMDNVDERDEMMRGKERDGDNVRNDVEGWR